MSNTIHVGGMSCEHCREAVTKAIKAVPGVSAVTVDLAAGKAEWEGDPQSAEAVKNAVRSIGFDAA